MNEGKPLSLSNKRSRLINEMNGIFFCTFHESNWRSVGDDGARHLLLQMTVGCFWKKILNDFDDYLDDDG